MLSDTAHLFVELDFPIKVFSREPLKVLQFLVMIRFKFGHSRI